jgi:hypothetical protein
MRKVLFSFLSVRDDHIITYYPVHTIKGSNFGILFEENIFFADLSLGYPLILSGIEICTENAQPLVNVILAFANV